tara:strand:+ start:41 stop:493 length:453 start_codon:yes stop_codon:yes gene_type:complete
VASLHHPVSDDNDDKIRKILDELKSGDKTRWSDFLSAISDNLVQGANSSSDSREDDPESDHFDIGVSHFYQDLIEKMDNGWIWHIPKTDEYLQIDKEKKCFVVLIDKETHELLMARIGISKYTDYEVIDIRQHLLNHTGKKFSEVFPWSS